MKKTQQIRLSGLKLTDLNETTIPWEKKKRTGIKLTDLNETTNPLGKEEKDRDEQ